MINGKDQEIITINKTGNSILNNAKYSADNTDEWYTTFVARSFDFGRKKRLQPPCAAISCFSYCEVNPLLFRLPLSPLLLRLQSVCLYRSYRPAARQAAAARWISPHCCSGRKIDLPKYDTGLQGHRIPVNSAVVPCSRYSQGSAGKYITRRLPFCGSRRIHFSRLL